MRNRPAETGAIASAMALLLTRLVLHLDDADLITALAIVIGGIPALVTWTVELRRKDAP